MAIEVDVNDNGTIDIEYGGTNATTPAGARTNLGLGTAAVLNAGNSDGDVVVIQTGQKLPTLDGSNLTNVQPVGGGVTSVNTETGDVVLDADDIQDGVNYAIITKVEQANIARNTLLADQVEGIEEDVDRAEAAAIAAEASEDAAALSETSAATSAAAAASSESSASLDAASATTSEGNAATSAASASTSETNAATSEANAATSETNAANSEAAATLAEINAGTSEDNALISENKAHLWAEETVDVEVEAGEYSAHHWAIKAGETAASISDHNDLTNIQGGATNDRQHLTTEQVLELDTVAELNTANGFDRQSPLTMGEISWDAASRTITIAPKSGEASFMYWVGGVKFTRTTPYTSESMPDVSGTYYFYFTETEFKVDNINNLTAPVFYKYAIVSGAYWNANLNEATIFEERHGVRMSSATHEENHETVGALHSEGFAIKGLADNQPTFTQIDSGKFYDEDISHHLNTETNAPFLFRLGAGEWVWSVANNNVAYDLGGDSVWNEDTGGSWQLTEATSSTDYFMTFFVASPTIKTLGNSTSNAIFKIIGQHAYANKSQARNAIESEVKKLILAGLPSPEFIFLGALIVRRNGNLEDLADGSLYLDLRGISSVGGGGDSVASNLAADITVNAAGFDGNLSPTDSDVQTALQTIDDLLLSDPVRTATRTEADFMALAAANRDKFSGSGSLSDIGFDAFYLPEVTTNILPILASKKNINGISQYLGDTDLLLPPASIDYLLTERQDLVFLESWHEKIADKDIVYPFGNTQSLLTTDEATGLATVNGSFSGYETYSLFGNWQTDSALIGKGLVWSTMSDVNKKEFVSDPENNVYLAEDGELVQVRYRIRVVEGLGVDYDITDASVYSQGSNVTITTNNFTLDDVDKGLYNSGDSEAIEIALVSRRNQGAFDNVFNPAGSSEFGDGNPFYTTTDSRNSTSDCFTSVGDGSISGAASGRPDGKFYDAIYEGDVLDLRNSAHKQDLTRTLEREFNKLIAGETRGWEKTPQTTTDGTVGGTASVATHIPNRELLWCDIIGDPTNYPQSWIDNGVMGTPLVVGEEGEDYLDYGTFGTISLIKLSKKTDALQKLLYSDDQGVTWIEGGNLAVGTGNKPNSAFVNEASRIFLLFYLTEASPFETADNAEVLKLGKPYANNSYLPTAGNVVTSALLNKVGVSSGAATSLRYTDLDNYALMSGVLAWEPEHNPINLQGVNPAVKALPYLTRENGKLYLQALFKEMKYDTDWGDDNKFDVVSGVSTTTDDNGNTILIGQKRIELPLFIGDVE